MISAFGIDHTDTVSKAGGGGFLRRVPKKPLAATLRPSGPARAKAALDSVGEAHVSVKGVGRQASRGAAGASSFMQNHPGLTGTAVVGGGGAAGYTYLRNKEPKRKKRES